MASRSERQPLKPAALIAFLALAGLLSPVAVPAAGAASGDVTGTVSFSLSDRRPDVPTGLTTRVTVGTPDGETAPTQLSRVQITLPDGVQFGAQARTAGGDFRLCDAGAFAVGGTLAAQCPADSAIGLATIAEAGETLTGTIYAGSVSAGGLPSIYVEASAGGSTAPGAVRMKLAGALAIGGDGRPGIVFDQIPAPPFSSLELSLSGGEGALFVTPRSCNAYAGVASLTGALTGAVVATSSTISVDQDCGARGFAPGVEVASDNPRAQAYTPSTAAVSRADRTPRIRSARIDAPSGLLANIGGMPECGLVGDAAPGCGPSTRIGTANLVVGLGAQPRTMSGPIYLTPRAPGAVAGAHVVVPVRLGDVSLGDLVVPVRIDLRPTDAGIGLTFDLPDRFRGVDLAVRRAELRFDAPGFTLNPSACSPLGYSAAISSDTGAAAFPTGQLSYSGCETLPFAPTLQASFTGETGPGGHPNVNVALNARAGDSNLRTATVVLPEGIAADLANIKNACPIESFNAVTCSANARVGTTTARVAVTPEPIPGDVYLVAIPGETLPGLGLSFTGRFSQRVLSITRIEQPSQRLIVRFDGIPDLPLRRLDMDIFGGARGPIKVSAATCPETAVWDATFSAHGSQASSHTIPAPCAPRVAKRSAITLSSTYGLSWRLTDLGGRSLQSAKLTLPGGFAVVKARASRRQYQSVKLSGAAAKLSFTTKAVIVTAAGKNTRQLAVKLKAGSVKRTVRLKPGQGTRRVKLKVRLAFTDGTVQNQSITVRAK